MYNLFKAMILIVFNYVIYMKMVGWAVPMLKKVTVGFFFFVLFSALLYGLSLCLKEPYKSLLMVILGSIYLKITTKELYEDVFAYMVISFTLSSIMFLLTSFIALFIIFSFFMFMYNDALNMYAQKRESFQWVVGIIASLMEAVYVFGFMKIKINSTNFKKDCFGDLWLLLSGVVLIFYSLSRQEDLSNRGWFMFIAGISISTAGLKSEIKKENGLAYNKKVNEQAGLRLKEELRTVQEVNDYLAKMSHKNMKLLPAYRKAVEEIIQSIPDGNEKINAVKLLNELQIAEGEQACEVQRELMKRKILPSTNMILLDAVFQHMFHEATNKNIEFDLIISGDMHGIVQKISQTQIEVLAADLINNAIIAVENGIEKEKSITVYFWISYDAYEIRVDDNGVPFNIDTVMQLGKHKVTTYAGKGGTGIGYITIFEILDQCNASLIIMEKNHIVYQDSKSVAVRFDDKNQKVIHSYRAEELSIHNQNGWMIKGFNEKI